MDTRTFLHTVLAETGVFCGWCSRGSKTNCQFFYDTVDELIEHSKNLADKGWDYYFAQGKFNKKGSRKADTNPWMRSFYVDVDCGDSKPYPDQQAAAKAIKEFVTTIGLPKPILVSSGRGIHAYWPFAEEVERDVWQPVANKLRSLTKAHNFHVDHTKTADAAAVLRLPETKHFKDDPPKTVKIFYIPEYIAADDFLSFEEFREIIGELAVPPKISREKIDDPVADAILSNYKSSFKVILQKTAQGKGCASLGNIIENQETVKEPQWRAALSIAVHTIEKDKAIHIISNKHPEYDPAKTEEKASGIAGPFLCETFERDNPGFCESCPHFGKIRSPISLGRIVEEATLEDNIVAVPTSLSIQPTAYQIPVYPKPYFRGKNGGIFKRVEKDGEIFEFPVYHNDIYVIRRMFDRTAGDTLVVRLHLPKDGIRDFALPASNVTSREELRKALAARGVLVPKINDLMDYFIQWTNKLQHVEKADNVRKQFGWLDDRRMDAFVLGTRVIYGDRIEYNPPSIKTDKIIEEFREEGTLEGWIETMKFYERPKMEMHQFVIGLGFGGFLFPFVKPLYGAIFHIYSEESGLGKTTSAIGMASIWGNPEEVVLKENDTMASRYLRMEVYKNIPIVFDEVTDAKPEELGIMAYSVPMGKQRNRMGPQGNVERERGDSWGLPVITTGNVSWHEKLSVAKARPSAEALRVLEVQAERVFAEDDEESKAITDKLSRDQVKNFGVVAVPLVQYAINNLPALRELFMQIQLQLDRGAKLTQPERYYSVLGAFGILGLIIGKKLGFINYNTENVFEWLIEKVKGAKTSVLRYKTDPEAVINDYLATNWNNILRIKSTDDTRTIQESLDHLVIPDSSPKISLVARYEYDKRELFLVIDPFKTWCIKRQINFENLVNNLRRGKSKAQYISKRMGKGTRMNLPSTRVLFLDASGWLHEEIEDPQHTPPAP